jgi:hypothetical protein
VTVPDLDAEIHVNDVGTALVVTITDETGAAVNVAAATNIKVYLTKPDGTVLTKTGVLDDDGTDGKIKYVTQAGDLSVKGAWKIQAAVTLGSASWSTRQAAFQVHASPRT